MTSIGTFGRGRGRGRGRGGRGEAPLPVVTVAPSVKPAAIEVRTQAPVETNDRTRRETFMLQRHVEQARQTAPRYNIGGVTFNFMSTEFIRKQAVVECSSSELSGLYSVNSPLMGTIDQNRECNTCHLIGIECPGHHGYINLSVPLPNPLAMDAIVQVLNSICGNCGRLLLPELHHRNPSILRLKGAARIKEIASIVSSLPSIKCPRNLELADAAGESETTQRMCPNVKMTYTGPKNSDDWKITVTVAAPNAQKRAGTRGGAKDEAKKVTRVVKVETIRTLFNSIPEADLRMLGLSGNSHPRNFIMEALPVIPECNRPPVERDGERKFDYLTLTYIHIIRNNDAVRALKAAHNANEVYSESQLADAISRLYFVISHFMNNSDGQFRLHKDDPALTIGTRLAGKRGLCRETAQGKRCDKVARSVIGPGIVPFGAIELPGVMRVITIPERAFEFNVERLNRLAALGEIVHITRARGEDRGLRRRMANLIADARATGQPLPRIELGDLVHRLADDGDDVIMNRQPTLHRHSFIGARALFRRRRNNVGIHMSNTTPMNADFDGDELNVNFITTNRARAETRFLISGTKQVITAATSSPATGLVFNAPSAAFLLSIDADADAAEYARTGVVRHTLTKSELEELADTILVNRDRLATLPERLRGTGIHERTPRALFSMVLPEGLYYMRKYKDVEVVLDAEGRPVPSDEDPELPKKREVAKRVLILNGIFLEGTLTKSDVAKGIVAAIHQMYGDEGASRFISEAAFLLDWYIEQRVFTIGLKDCLLSDRAAARKAVNKKVTSVFNEISVLNSAPPRSELEAQYREIETCSILNSVGKVGLALMNSSVAGEGNPLNVMIASGAKGSDKNMAQIAGALGQQFIVGKRPQRTLYGGRTLPFFEAGDESPVAHGFIRESFSDGQRPASFMYHMSAGRVGLLDTAIHTADIGTLTHRAKKMLENDYLDYLGAVVTTMNTITSPSYGEGYSGTELQLVSGFVSTGDMFMPFNVRKLANMLNAEAGYE